MINDEPVGVHVLNWEEAVPVARTEEVEPEHFSCVTFVLQAPTPNNPGANWANILELDPLRKDATILSPDNPVVVCHTFRQVQDPANQVANVPFPDGAYLPAGASLSVSGTGPLWVVATTTATNSRVSVAINRRGAA
jgi:hypothetical protein